MLLERKFIANCLLDFNKHLNTAMWMDEDISNNEFRFNIKNINFKQILNTFEDLDGILLDKMMAGLDGISSAIFKSIFSDSYEDYIFINGIDSYLQNDRKRFAAVISMEKKLILIMYYHENGLIGTILKSIDEDRIYLKVKHTIPNDIVYMSPRFFKNGLSSTVAYKLEDPAAFELWKELGGQDEEDY